MHFAVFESTLVVSGRHTLRHVATNHLVAPSFKLSAIGRRAFPTAAARTWNALPDGGADSMGHGRGHVPPTFTNGWARSP